MDETLRQDIVQTVRGAMASERKQRPHVQWIAIVSLTIALVGIIGTAFGAWVTLTNRLAVTDEKASALTLQVEQLSAQIESFKNDGDLGKVTSQKVDDLTQNVELLRQDMNRRFDAIAVEEHAPHR